MVDRIIIDANKLWQRLEEMNAKLESLVREYRELEKWIIQNTESF